MSRLSGQSARRACRAVRSAVSTDRTYRCLTVMVWATQKQRPAVVMVVPPHVPLCTPVHSAGSLLPLERFTQSRDATSSTRRCLSLGGLSGPSVPAGLVGFFGCDDVVNVACCRLEGQTGVGISTGGVAQVATVVLVVSPVVASRVFHSGGQPGEESEQGIDPGGICVGRRG